MKTAEDWNRSYISICEYELTVHGQLLPTTKMVEFIKLIQKDALEHAARLAEKIGVHLQQDNNKTEELGEPQSTMAQGAFMAASRICLEAQNIFGAEWNLDYPTREGGSTT